MDPKTVPWSTPEVTGAGLDMGLQPILVFCWRGSF